MNVSVDSSYCAGHGTCALLCPSVFDLDEDGHATVLVAEPEASLHSAVLDAVDNCPEQAISVAE